MTRNNFSRRTYLAALGAAGLASVAGCSAISGGTDATETSTGTASPDGQTDVKTIQKKTVPDFGGYLEEANNYDGKVVDATGKDAVTVKVGADKGLAFDPASVHVDNGATVQWKWTGKGAGHSVVAEDGTFNSGNPVQTTGIAFEYTFNEDGIYHYYCVVHKGQGMKGAVVVGTDYPSYTYTPPAQKWRFETGGTLQSAPTVSDGTVYVDSGTVYALDAATGTEQWSAKPDGKPGYFAPVVTDDTVYVGGGSRLSALDVATGRQKWSTETGRKAIGSLTVVDGTAYFPVANVQAIDTKTGEQGWTFNPRGYSPSGIVVADGTVYFESYQPDSKTTVLYAVDAATGSLQWRDEVSPVGPPIAVNDGIVYAATYDKLYALDATADQQLWTVKTTCRMTYDSALHVTDGTVIVGCPNGSVYSLDSETGDQEWRLTLDGRIDSLVVNGTTIYAGTDGGDEGRLYAIDMASGRQNVIYEGRGDVATITSTTAYLGGGRPAAVSVQSGERKWLFRPGVSRTLLAVSEGTVFAGTENGIIYALTEQ